MKGKDIPAISAIKGSLHGVTGVPRGGRSMGVKGIRVLAAVVNQDGKSCLKLATQLKFHFFFGPKP